MAGNAFPPLFANCYTDPTTFVVDASEAGLIKSFENYVYKGRERDVRACVCV